MSENPQAGLKDRDLQDYYEAMQAMFATPGWTYMTEDLQKIYLTAYSIEGIENEAQLNFRRGQIDILKLVVAQPAVIDAAYEQLLAEEANGN